MGTENPVSRRFTTFNVLLTRTSNKLRGLPPGKILSGHEDEVSRIFVRNDDIVEVHLLATYYNGKRVLAVIDRIKAMKDRPRLLVLVVTEPRSMVTYSGMTAVFSPSAANYSMARAYVFQTYTQFFLARLGKFIARPKTPMRFFRFREDAEEWLSSFQGYGM